MNALWTEVWIDDSSHGEVLVVVRALKDGTFELLEPNTAKAPERFESYDELVGILEEDEYVRVDGRIGGEEAAQ